MELIQMSQDIYFAGKQQIGEYIIKSPLKSNTKLHIDFCMLRAIPVVGLKERPG